MNKIFQFLKSIFYRKKYLCVIYEKPVKGYIYKKGCFDNINKIVSIKKKNKIIGKGKLLLCRRCSKRRR